MKQVHVIATWRSEHVVELEDESGAEPLDEVVDAAIDQLLDE